MKIPFTKYQGLGNDFILIDNRHSPEPLITPEIAVAMCDRHFGIGGDGVIFLLPGQAATDYTMRIFNSDGSEPEMCGNGIRCLAQFIARLEADNTIGRTCRIHTPVGTMIPRLEANEQVTVDMGPPQLLGSEIPTTLVKGSEKVLAVPLEVAGKDWLVTCVSMGNPHCVTFVDDLASIPLATIGTKFEHHPVFPQRTNVEVIAPDYMKMRVWELLSLAVLVLVPW